MLARRNPLTKRLATWLGILLTAGAAAGAEDFYGWPRQVVPGPEEALVMRALVEAIPARNGKTLQWDAGLVESARRTAERLTRDYRPRGGKFSDEYLERRLREAGVWETRLGYRYLFFEQEHELKEFIRRQVSSPALEKNFTHLAAGLARGPRGPDCLVVLFTVKPVQMDPFPRKLSGAAEARLSGMVLAPGRESTVKALLMSPSGKVMPLEMQTQAGRFQGRVPFQQGEGWYRVELLLDQGLQSMVAGVLEVQVGSSAAGTGADFYAGSLHYLNEAEAEMTMVRMINSFRARQGLPLLRVHPGLMVMAREQSRDMKRNRYFGHNSPTRGDLNQRRQAFGFSRIPLQENLAVHTNLNGAMSALLQSPAHRRNLLQPHFNSVGVGVAILDFGEFQSYYITQELAQFGD